MEKNMIPLGYSKPLKNAKKSQKLSIRNSDFFTNKRYCLCSLSVEFYNVINVMTELN